MPLTSETSAALKNLSNEIEKLITQLQENSTVENNKEENKKDDDISRRKNFKEKLNKLIEYKQAIQEFKGDNFQLINHLDHLEKEERKSIILTPSIFPCIYLVKFSLNPNSLAPRELFELGEWLENTKIEKIGNLNLIDIFFYEQALIAYLQLPLLKDEELKELLSRQITLCESIYTVFKTSDEKEQNKKEQNEFENNKDAIEKDLDIKYKTFQLHKKINKLNPNLQGKFKKTQQELLNDINQLNDLLSPFLTEWAIVTKDLELRMGTERYVFEYNYGEVILNYTQKVWTEKSLLEVRSHLNAYTKMSGGDKKSKFLKNTITPKFNEMNRFLILTHQRKPCSNIELTLEMTELHLAFFYAEESSKERRINSLQIVQSLCHSTMMQTCTGNINPEINSYYRNKAIFYLAKSLHLSAEEKQNAVELTGAIELFKVIADNPNSVFQGQASYICYEAAKKNKDQFDEMSLRAHDYLMLAADSGIADACFDLGMYFQKSGDVDSAKKLMLLAAQQNHPNALMFLGKLSENEFHREQKIEYLIDAKKYYTLAGKHGFPFALYKLGRFEEIEEKKSGKNSTKKNKKNKEDNKKTSNEWYKQAEEFGLALLETTDTHKGFHSYLLGKIYFRLGDITNSKKFFNYVSKTTDYTKQAKAQKWLKKINDTQDKKPKENQTQEKSLIPRSSYAEVLIYSNKKEIKENKTALLRKKYSEYEDFFQRNKVEEAYDKANEILDFLQTNFLSENTFLEEIKTYQMLVLCLTELINKNKKYNSSIYSEILDKYYEDGYKKCLISLNTTNRQNGNLFFEEDEVIRSYLEFFKLGVESEDPEINIQIKENKSYVEELEATTLSSSEENRESYLKAKQALKQFLDEVLEYLNNHKPLKKKTIETLQENLPILYDTAENKKKIKTSYLYFSLIGALIIHEDPLEFIRVLAAIKIDFLGKNNQSLLHILFPNIAFAWDKKNKEYLFFLQMILNKARSLKPERISFTFISTALSWYEVYTTLEKQNFKRPDEREAKAKGDEIIRNILLKQNISPSVLPCFFYGALNILRLMLKKKGVAIYRDLPVAMFDSFPQRKSYALRRVLQLANYRFDRKKEKNQIYFGTLFDILSLEKQLKSEPSEEPNNDPKIKTIEQTLEISPTVTEFVDTKSEDKPENKLAHDQKENISQKTEILISPSKRPTIDLKQDFKKCRKEKKLIPDFISEKLDTDLNYIVEWFMTEQRTPLYYAIICSLFPLVKKLCEHEKLKNLIIEKINLPIDDFGSTYLHLACAHNYRDEEIFQYLHRELNASIKLEKEPNRTYLWYAVEHGTPFIFEYLLKKLDSSDIQKTFQKNNILHYIALRNDERCLAIFLKTSTLTIEIKKQMLSQKNNDNKTPIDLAINSLSDMFIQRLINEHFIDLDLFKNTHKKINALMPAKELRNKKSNYDRTKDILLKLADEQHPFNKISYKLLRTMIPFIVGNPDVSESPETTALRQIPLEIIIPIFSFLGKNLIDTDTSDMKVSSGFDAEFSNFLTNLFQSLKTWHSSSEKTDNSLISIRAKKDLIAQSTQYILFKDVKQSDESKTQPESNLGTDKKKKRHNKH